MLSLKDKWSLIIIYCCLDVYYCFLIERDSFCTISLRNETTWVREQQEGDFTGWEICWRILIMSPCPTPHQNSLIIDFMTHYVTVEHALALCNEINISIPVFTALIFILHWLAYWLLKYLPPQATNVSSPKGQTVPSKLDLTKKCQIENGNTILRVGTILWDCPLQQIVMILPANRLLTITV